MFWKQWQSRRVGAENGPDEPAESAGGASSEKTTSQLNTLTSKRSSVAFAEEEVIKFAPHESGSLDGHPNFGTDVPDEDFMDHEETDEEEDDERSDLDDVPEDQQEQESESDAEAELAKLEANLYATHPKLQDPRRLVPDFELESAIRLRRNPAVSFNAKMVMGGRVADTLGARQVPHAVVITGHRGGGGNIGLNGVYELFPDAFHDRPVYQKMLEKRELLQEEFPPGRIRPRSLHDQQSRFEAGRSQRALIVKAPQRSGGATTMKTVRDAYFLFFDRGNGCWCVGPRVGHSEIYARCPGTEELLPDKLDRWEVWNAGQKRWYEHNGLRTHKGCGPDRAY